MALVQHVSSDIKFTFKCISMMCLWHYLSEGADLWESGIVKSEQYIKVLIDVWQAAY